MQKSLLHDYAEAKNNHEVHGNLSVWLLPVDFNVPQ